MSKKKKTTTKKSTKKKTKKASPKKSKSRKLLLTDIQGIGPKMAENLQAGGFKTVASLSKTTPEKLMKKVEGVGEVTASKIIAAAKKLIEKGPSEKTISKSRRVKPKAKKSTTRKKSVPKPSTELDELTKELQSDDEQVILGAIDRLGMITDPKATGILLSCLKDPRYMIRIHAAAQLGERKDKQAVVPLIEALQDESIFVRQTAAGALENIGGAKAKKAVSNAEKDGLLLDDLPEGRRLEQK